MTTYQTREEGLNAFITEARPIFETIGYQLPASIRASIGYPPNTRARDNASGDLAVIVHHKAVGDGHFEIFVSPVNADDVAVFAALTHELAHAVTEFARGGKRPHGVDFGKCARALGLEGPLRATKPGAAWFAWAAPIVEDIDMPYAHIDLSAGVVNKPTKDTYALKIECPSCKWHARASAKQAYAAEYLNCPLPDCGDILIIHPRGSN